MRIIITADTTEGLVDQEIGMDDIHVIEGDQDSAVADFVYACLSHPFIREIRIVRD